MIPVWMWRFPTQEGIRAYHHARFSYEVVIIFSCQQEEDPNIHLPRLTPLETRIANSKKGVSTSIEVLDSAGS